MRRLLLALVVAGCAGSGTTPARPEPAVDPVGVPFRLDHNLLVVTGTVNGGPPLTLIVDTGASGSVVTPDAARRSGLDPTRGDAAAAQAADGAAQPTILLPPAEVSLGGHGFPGLRLAVVDLAALTGSLGERIDGIVGLDLLGRGDLEVDRQAAVLRLHLRPRAWGEGGCGFELGDEGLIRVPARLGEHDIAAVLDLGAVGSMVNWAAAGLAGIGRDHPGLERMEGAAAAGALGGEFAVYRASFPRLDVCDQTLVDQPLQVSDIPAFAGVIADGVPALLLGNDILERYRLVIAFASRRVHLLPR